MSLPTNKNVVDAAVNVLADRYWSIGIGAML
jgi:hypothetical protein